MANELAVITKHINPNLYEDCYVYSVKMLWNTTTEPVPTFEQLEAVLLRKLSVRPEITKRVCAMYKKHFSSASSCVEPRSLKHLSRCSVRRCMDRTDDIELLPLPDQLKAYLHFRSYKIYRFWELKTYLQTTTFPWRTGHWEKPGILVCEKLRNPWSIDFLNKLNVRKAYFYDRGFKAIEELSRIFRSLIRGQCADCESSIWLFELGIMNYDNFFTKQIGRSWYLKLSRAVFKCQSATS